MKYWLLKSEPNVWSLDQQKKAGTEGAVWDGVRNYQAANNLKKMSIGDLCFFYHSNIGKEIVGTVEVIKEAFLDPTDEENKFVAVKVRYKSSLNIPISLNDIKNKNVTPTAAICLYSLSSSNLFGFIIECTFGNSNSLK